MFTPIEIEPNSHAHISLFDTHDITIHRDGNGNAELVIHPVSTGEIVSVRQAKRPYACTLVLANGEEQFCDLSCEDDWGNVQQCNPEDCEDWEDAIGWGNDEDGHIKIVRVYDEDGNDIPLEEFKRDVEDFLFLYEG